MLSLYLPIFLNTDLLLCLYTHLYTNSEHRSPLPLGLISTPSWSYLLFLCSTLKPQALSLPQALNHNNRCTCRESFQSSTDLSCQRSQLPTSIFATNIKTHSRWPISIDRSSQAPIIPVKYRSSFDLSLCWFFYVGLFVCGCVYVFMCWFVCVDVLCMGVFVCIWEKRRWGEKSLSLLCTEKREKKMCVHEINKIITYTSIVTVHICTVTVANM